MLGEARKLCLPKSIRLDHRSWEEIDEHFRVFGTYDFAFILGHALPHAETGCIPAILKKIYGGLRPGGALVFDMRNWVRSREGALVQPDRPPGFRSLGEIDVAQGRCRIEDNCEYAGGRQRLTYRFLPCQPGLGREDTQRDTVMSFALFSAEEACAWLREAGFALLPDPPVGGWPYLTLAGRRSP